MMNHCLLWTTRLPLLRALFFLVGNPPQDSQDPAEVFPGGLLGVQQSQLKKPRCLKAVPDTEKQTLPSFRDFFSSAVFLPRVAVKKSGTSAAVI